MKSLIRALVIVLALGTATAQGERYFPQFADGVLGEIRYQTTLKFINTGTDVEIVVEFFDDAGGPLNVSAGALGGTGASFHVSLQQGQVLSSITPGEGPLVSGYVRLSAPESVTGTVIYTGTDSQSNTALFEAGVPATYLRREVTVLLDSLGDRNSGLALVVSPSLAAGGNSSTIHATLFDQHGQPLASKDMELEAGQKVTRFIHELFAGDPEAVGRALEMEGSLSIVTENLPVAAVSLRQLVSTDPYPASVPVVTTFPVTPRVVDAVQDVTERVLVFAPHPDDEALGCAGVLRRALNNGDEVRVVVATCGDAYRGAKLAFEESFPSESYDRDGDNDFDMLDYGILRSGETLAAMAAVGLEPSDVVFLGYPDAGLDDLWRSSEVYLSGFTGVSEVPESYDFAYNVGASYQRDSILADIKNQILEFGPTVIYSPTDTDHHQDHWGLAKLVNQALIELTHVRTWKSHFGYLIHWEANEEGWPTSSTQWTAPRGHAPPDLWVTLRDFDYSRDEKSDVIDLYESQVFVGRAYLVGFAKDAEIFWLESW
jgi:LmbE family N-acetylglucosaminyl deacetylase